MPKNEPKIRKKRSGEVVENIRVHKKRTETNRKTNRAKLVKMQEGQKNTFAVKSGEEGGMIVVNRGQNMSHPSGEIFFTLAACCDTLMNQLKQTIAGQDIQMEEISKILPLIFRSQIRRNNPRVAEILAPLWPQVAGKPMARHSMPVAFEEGTLTLESDCAAWSKEMRQMGDDIRAQINRYLGAPTVRRLKVRYVARPAWTTLPPPDETKVN